MCPVEKEKVYNLRQVWYAAIIKVLLLFLLKGIVSQSYLSLNWKVTSFRLERTYKHRTAGRWKKKRGEILTALCGLA
jgi:hypothetical protein